MRVERRMVTRAGVSRPPPPWVAANANRLLSASADNCARITPRFNQISLQLRNAHHRAGRPLGRVCFPVTIVARILQGAGLDAVTWQL